MRSPAGNTHVVRAGVSWCFTTASPRPRLRAAADRWAPNIYLLTTTNRMPVSLDTLGRLRVALELATLLSGNDVYLAATGRRPARH